MKNFVVVIPARYASVRLPGKPLRPIAGEPMIQHVHRLAMQSKADEVWIATDDERIEATTRGFGANVCMTSADHHSGTERLAEVCELQSWPDDLVVVNLQGDEPLLPPVLIDECAALLDDDSVGMGTLASPMEMDEDLRNPNVAKIVIDQHDNALYFSRAPIPYSRDEHTDKLTMQTALRHHGIYAYRCAVLRQLIAAGPCDMEQCEKLEQLRALWLGITVRVGRASVRPGPGVDTEEDIAAVENALKSVSAF
ncbi:MAG: 3-deoxy-manno-octulosonate cytidylyltransferase [Gammaproteobacteria bacterium]|nr:MAG: 3-deoxy-manno-octulosonate cytidylyltransferase [Gammaproteobacteria bacterium]